MTLTTDTADRLRATDHLLINGKPLLVLNITDASTRANPARLAIAVCDPNGPLSDLNNPDVIGIDAGEIVSYRPGSTHLADVAGRRPGGATVASGSAPI